MLLLFLEIKAAEDGLLHLHSWVINDWAEYVTVQLSLGGMDHQRRWGGVRHPSYASRLPSCEKTGKCMSALMCECKHTVCVNVSLLLWTGVGCVDASSRVVFVSGGLSCSSVDVWWKTTVPPIGPLMGARCHWSQTGHVWCINSTASAWGGKKRNKEYKCLLKVAERWMTEFDQMLLRRCAHLAAWELAEVRFEILSDHCVNCHQTEYAGLPDAALRVVVTLSNQRKHTEKPAGFLVPNINPGFSTPRPTHDVSLSCLYESWHYFRQQVDQTVTGNSLHHFGLHLDGS